MPPFKIHADHVPTGDQPTAIDHLVEGIRAGEPHITLLGATGTGKTFTIANVVERVQRPTIVIAPNKSLAAQLANEFREAFPENAVEYFVSYYDYYQPEAYVPSTDTYIEKDSSINDEIERLRHSATAALLTRRDVLIVASVSCIYGLGSPEEYEGQILRVHKGVATDMEWSKQRLVDIQYLRNQANLARGKFRVQGDVLEVHPSYEETAVRIEWWGDTIERITRFDPLTGEMLGDLTEITVFPASHYVASDERMKRAVVSIEEELQGAAGAAREPEQAPGGRTPADAHDLRPRDAARGRVLLRHRELLAPHRRSRARARRRTRCWTTSPTTGSA